MTTTRLFATAAVVVLAACSAPASDTEHTDQAENASEPVQWGYADSAGPAQWASLDSAWATCQVGLKQSPIDLANLKRVDLPDISTAYAEGTVHVENNGHTIQLTPSNTGELRIGEDRYALLEAHFHHPSEHTIAGRVYPLELHLVHRNSAGALAVLGVLFETGAPATALDDVWSKLPQSKGESSTATIDFGALIPADRSHFAYNGSLTTPPCSEGVRWTVLEQPLTASAAQITAFEQLFPLNARPVQPLNGREVSFGQ